MSANQHQRAPAEVRDKYEDQHVVRRFPSLPRWTSRVQVPSPAQIRESPRLSKPRAFLLLGGSLRRPCNKACNKPARPHVGVGPRRPLSAAVIGALAAPPVARDRRLRHRDHLALAERDAELRDLLAEGRPGKRRVEIDDVAARAVRDVLENVLARPIGPGERHERPAEIVNAPRAECALRRLRGRLLVSSGEVAHPSVGVMARREGAPWRRADGVGQGDVLMRVLTVPSELS